MNCASLIDWSILEAFSIVREPTKDITTIKTKGPVHPYLSAIQPTIGPSIMGPRPPKPGKQTKLYRFDNTLNGMKLS